jgi:hypothetical protein
MDFLNVLTQHLQANARSFQTAYSQALLSKDKEVINQLIADKEIQENAITNGVTSAMATMKAWINVGREAQQLSRG